MFEVIGVNGNILRLDHLPDEEKKKSLSYEIVELLETFGPMKKQLVLNYFSQKYVTIVLECMAFMLRLKKIYEYEDYVTVDPRFFDENNYTVPKINGQENTFEKVKNFNLFLAKLEMKQKAFAVFLFFRDEVGSERWFLNENYRKPWLILSFIAREKLFFVFRIEDYNELYAYDISADPKEVRDRLCIVLDESEKKEIAKKAVKGVAAYVTVDQNYCVTVKKADPV